MDDVELEVREGKGRAYRYVCVGGSTNVAAEDLGSSLDDMVMSKF